MSAFDSKVVSFERNASYLRERAMKNKRGGRDIDALELMRKAVEREPEIIEYRLDLAILCAEMGLFEQASKALSEVLAKNPRAHECIYAMGLCLYKKGEIARAERVLRAYADIKEQGEKAAEARRLLDEIAIAREVSRPDRATMRAMRLVNSACVYMNRGKCAIGEKLFKRAIRLNDTAPEVHALIAISCHLNNKDEEARMEIDTALRNAEKRPDSRVRTVTIAAQALFSMGEAQKAQALLLDVSRVDANENDARLRLNALAELGLHEEIYREASRLLAEAPYDKTLMHMISVSAWKTGRTEADIASGWQRILRLDPQDPVAAYYLEAARKQPEKLEAGYIYELPESEIQARIRTVAAPTLMGQGMLQAAWENDERFRSIIEREILREDSRFTRLAFAALIGIQTDETTRMAQVYAERPDISLLLRTYIMQGMKLINGAYHPLLDEPFINAGMPAEDEAMEGLSVPEKQMIRYAAEYIEDKYSDYPVADIALLWRAFMEKRAGLGDPVRRADAGSAALSMCYLNMVGRDDDIYTISRWYGCSARQAAYIAKLIRDSVNSVEAKI